MGDPEQCYRYRKIVISLSLTIFGNYQYSLWMFV
jgi:hypothetical protein